MYRNLKRVRYIMYILLCLISLLGIRLYFLQLCPTEKVVSQYTNQQSESICDRKYFILDTNGRDLSKYDTEYVVVIDKKPFSLNSYEKSLESLMTLYYIMKEEYKDFSYDKIMTTNGKTYYKVSTDTYEKIKKIKSLKGIYEYERKKVDTSNSWNIANYLGNIKDGDSYDKKSLQYKLQKSIKNNETIKEEFYLDNNFIFSTSKNAKLENNKNIKLTLNQDIQDKIKTVLEKENYSYLKDIGVIIMESDTGKIRAMVQKDDSMPNVNLCVDGIGYEPGSVFKLITLSAALEEGLVKMDDMYYCSGKVCNKNDIHGWISVENALYKSCNDTFAAIGNKVGYDNLMKFAENMGLFQKTLSLKDETSGVVPKAEAGLNNISIGQCMTVSPIQLLGAVNTIVNNGVYVKPYLVESIVDSEGKDVEVYSTQQKKIMSDATAEIVKNGMIGVVKYGTGKKAAVDGVNIGGKTGSATSGSKITTHGWFVGCFTYGEKTYTMAVFAPNIPNNSEGLEELGGGNTAAPIFGDIVKNIIN